MTNVKETLERWARIVGGCAWGADKGKPRIYFNVCKGRKVFISFPDHEAGIAEDLGGGRLNVYFDDCGQAPAWYASQKRIMLERFTAHSLAICACTAGDEAFAADIMLLDEIAEDDVNAVSHALANGRIEEAKAIIARQIAEAKT